MRIFLLLATTVLFASACETGPDPVDVEAAMARKVCGRLFSSSSKVYQDELYKRGVAEVKFAVKAEFVDKCAGMKLSKDDLRCADPNLASSEDCKTLSADLSAKHKELKDFMIAPTIALLKAKASGGAAEGQAAGGVAPAQTPPAEAAPADVAAVPADGAAVPADGAAVPADGEAEPAESAAK